MRFPRVFSDRRVLLGVMVIALAAGLGVGALLWPGTGAPPAVPRDAGTGDARTPHQTPAPRPTVPVARPGPGALSLPGDVVDAAGVPVAGAVITAEIELGPGLTVATPGLDTTPAVVAIAGADGTFTLVGLAPGRYRLRVEGQGIFTAEVRFFEVPAESVRLVVARQVAIAGAVVDPAGGPVNDLPVTLLRDDAIVARVHTDAGGGFAFDGLSEGVFQVWSGAGTRAAPAVAVVRLGPGPFEPVTLTLGPAVILEGRVVDRQTGAGVRAAVTLAATAADQPARHGTSDDAGGFRIEAVPRGRWSIDAWAPGYLTTEAIEIEIDDTPVSPVVTLTPGGVLAGRVVDHRGRPVENAVVRARGTDAGGRAVALSQQDELQHTRRLRGQAPLASLPSGAKFLPRGELGVLLGPIPLPPPPGAATVRVAERVPALGALAGTGAGTGAGAGSATAGAVPGDHDAGAALPPGAAPDDLVAAAGEHAAAYVTDAQGRFRLTGVPQGRFQIVAAHPDYADGRSGFLSLALGQRREDLSLVLVPGVVVVGTVANPRGEPIVGALITAEPLARRPRGGGAAPATLVTDTDGRLQAVTGTDGRYRLGPIAADVRLHVTATGHGAAERAVRLGAAGARAPARDEPVERVEDFVLVVADATLRGRVRDASGFPVRGARVTLDSDDAFARGRSATTDHDGRFAIPALAPGEYRFDVVHPEFPPASNEGSTASDVEVALAFGGGVDGEVRDVHSGAPVAGARIVATGPGRARQELAAAEDGGFSLTPVAAGAWTLRVTAAGYVPATPRRVDVPAGSAPGQVTARDVRVELERGATVAGVVRDDNGDRVAGARVRAGAAETRTDIEGSFRLADVPTGDTEVTADHQGASGGVTVPLRPGDEVLTLEITIE